MRNVGRRSFLVVVLAATSLGFKAWGNPQADMDNHAIVDADQLDGKASKDAVNTVRYALIRETGTNVKPVSVDSSGNNTGARLLNLIPLRGEFQPGPNDEECDRYVVDEGGPEYGDSEVFNNASFKATAVLVMDRSGRPSLLIDRAYWAGDRPGIAKFMRNISLYKEGQDDGECTRTYTENNTQIVERYFKYKMTQVN